MKMKKFQKAFERNYKWFYDNADKGVKYYSLEFEQFMNDNTLGFKTFLDRFIDYRHDPVLSDREAATFALTFNEFMPSFKFADYYENHS